MAVWGGLVPAQLACALTLVPARPATAQEADVVPRIRVQVRQVAGRNVYFEIGTRHGLAVGDTLVVRRDVGGVPIGRLVVTAATAARSVLGLVDEALAVTRGEEIILELRRLPQELPEPLLARPPTRQEGAPGRLAPGDIRTEASTQAERPVNGRWSMDLAARRSTTRVGLTDARDVRRTFATPAVRLDLTVPGAVGGFELRTSLRLAYRYSDRDLFERGASTRVYTASLERGFTRIPLRLALGRFYSPVESYSGYWDGVMARWGGPGVGAGALVGFQPDRWNEMPSTALPKATVFVDGEARGQGWAWQGDVSAHTVRPTSDLDPHTFLGVSQRFSRGALRLSEDLQVDRAPRTGVWRVSALRVRTTFALTRRIDVRLGVARDERYRLWTLSETFGRRRDRIDGGLGLRTGRGYVGVDVSAGRERDGETSRGATATLSLPRLVPGRSIGLLATASVWDGDRGSVLALAPGLVLELGPRRIRGGYRLYRSDYLGRVLTTHALDVSGSVTLRSGFALTGSLRGQWGDGLRAQLLQVTVARAF
jgi:hypothetical protein